MSNPAGKKSNEAIARETWESIEEYFNIVAQSCNYATILGLALHLGLSKQQVLKPNKDEIGAKAAPIARARDLIVESVEQMLLSSKGTNQSLVAWLTNNGDYRSKADVAIPAPITVQIVHYGEEPADKRRKPKSEAE